MSAPAQSTGRAHMLAVAAHLKYFLQTSSIMHAAMLGACKREVQRWKEARLLCLQLHVCIPAVE